MESNQELIWEASPVLPPVFVWAMAVFAGAGFLFGGVMGLVVLMAVKGDPEFVDFLFLIPTLLVPALFLGLFSLAKWSNKVTFYRVYSNGLIQCKSPFQVTEFELKPTTKFSVTKSPVIGNIVRFDEEAGFSFAMIENPDEVRKLLNDMISKAQA